MAKSISYGDALTERNYRAGVTLATQLQTYSASFEGDDEDSPNAAVCVVERPGSKRGDTVELRFSDINYDEVPKTRMSQVLGQESSTPNFTDSLNIRYFLFDGGVENVPTDQQMVSFDVKKGEIERIVRQWAYLYDKSWIYQGVGYTVVNSDADYARSGGNEVTAQDSNHIIYVGSGNTTAANVGGDTTAVFTTRVIDDMLTQATSRAYVKWPMAPCQTPFGELFVCLVHGTGWQSMRENGSDSDFYDLSRADIEGGGGFLSNPLITGEGTIYNNTLILKSDFMPPSPDAAGTADEANTRMALLFGARGWHKVYGEGFTDGNHLGWSEHMQHRRWSCLADTIYGCKRTIVDSETWGTFTAVHYSAA